MSVGAVIAIIGGIALLVGLFGGGIRIKEAWIPLLPKWSRTLSGMIGFILIILAAWLEYMPKPPSAPPTMASLTTTTMPTLTLEPTVVTATPVNVNLPTETTTGSPAYTPNVEQITLSPPQATPSPMFYDPKFCDDANFDQSIHQCRRSTRIFDYGTKRIYYTFEVDHAFPGMHFSWEWTTPQGVRPKEVDKWDEDQWKNAIEWNYYGCDLDSQLERCDPLPKGTYRLKMYIEDRLTNVNDFFQIR